MQMYLPFGTLMYTLQFKIVEGQSLWRHSQQQFHAHTFCARCILENEESFVENPR